MVKKNKKTRNHKTKTLIGRKKGDKVISEMIQVTNEIS